MKTNWNETITEDNVEIWKDYASGLLSLRLADMLVETSPKPKTLAKKFGSSTYARRVLRKALKRRGLIG